MLEKIFESFLWSSRFIVLVAVICSLLLSINLFIITTFDVFNIILHSLDYFNVADKKLFKTEVIAHIVSSIDGFLLAIILLIFSLGLYELFISDIDNAKKDKRSSGVLVINSLDDLKNKLAKVILMILVVTFFEVSLSMNFNNVLDLVYFALGILLVSLALYFTTKK